MSDIPRLNFNDLRADIASALRPKYERLGYLGEFFAATAHQPDALIAFIEFTDAAKGELDTRIVELIALTVACIKNVPYEKNQHERLSINLGYGAPWVSAVERLQPEKQKGLSAEEQLIQRFVIDAVARDGNGMTDIRRSLVTEIGHIKTVAVLMVMARYTTHALLVNALDIDAPVASIFEG